MFLDLRMFRDRERDVVKGLRYKFNKDTGGWIPYASHKKVDDDSSCIIATGFTIDANGKIPDAVLRSVGIHP